MRLETAYGWGNLTRMAVHTSVGFIVASVGLICFVWQKDLLVGPRLPRWMPVPLFVAVLTLTLCLWQALAAEGARMHQRYENLLARVRGHLRNYRRQKELVDRNRELATGAREPGDDTASDHLAAMIRAGESDRFELKSTLRWNLKADRPGKEIENAWLKTVVAFLNTDGGMLVVGVDDGGKTLGIEADRFKDGDRYLLHANSLIRDAIGAELTPFIDFGLRPLDGKEVFVVRCRPSPEPVFLKRDGEEEFYVRIGPGSRKLRASEILSYVQSRQTASADVLPQARPISRDVPTDERILLVDDNTQNLKVLYRTLDGRGHELLVARSGEEALKTAAHALPSLVLLDIMMPPGIDGYETCRRLKDEQATRDIPVIFMSALDETRDKVRGFDLGAVDYIIKPFQADEVIARVDTHLTIQSLQRDLRKRNDDLSSANARMTKDLRAAAQLQQSLLPDTLPDVGPARFEWLYLPCDELAGDALGVIELGERQAGLFVLDVTGHGVPAALLSVSITHHLLQRDPDHSIIFRRTASGDRRSITTPSQVAAQLNRLFPMDQATGQFFTMIYAVLDMAAHRIRYAAAGHPGPLVIRSDGAIELHDSTGLPIGIDGTATFEEHTIDLDAGDRVFLYSDGTFEEMNEQGKLFGRERLKSTLAAGGGASVADALSAFRRTIEDWSGSTNFHDDISIVAAELIAAAL
ncbi:MAG: hypothetical protein CMJ18_26325 [Phycisphaeraceae bacterium]|nr:hypothetical protein [Phycisphaeraceae bacterium]